MTRTPLETFGDRPHTVTVYVEGDRVWCLWRERGQRRKESWPDSRRNRRVAKTWAKAFAETRRSQLRPRVPVTVGMLWERFVEAEFPTLRPKTQKVYAEYWRAWSVYAGDEVIAEDLGVGTVTSFKADLERRGWAPNTMHRAIQTVKTVYAWGMRSEVLGRNGVREYRFKTAKEKRREKPGEYRSDELSAILAELPLDRATTWRAHGVLAICGYQGARVNAVLHLTWEDIDLEAGLIRWRARWDKLGRDETQPMRQPTRAVLEAIQTRTNGHGWLFPSGSDKNKGEVYGHQALIVALRGAERRAGVTPQPYRGPHGLRRMLFNDVLKATGDVGAAMAAIRDTSLEVASKYLRPRRDQVAEAFRKLDQTALERPPTGMESDEGTSVGLGSDAEPTTSEQA